MTTEIGEAGSHNRIFAPAKERLRCYHDIAGEVESTGKCSWNIVPFRADEDVDVPLDSMTR